MTEGFTVSYCGDHVRVNSNAVNRNLAYSTALWGEVVRVCSAHKCFRVLGVSTAVVPMPVSDGFDHAELFQELGIDRRYRIAWAELDDGARPTIAFIETVLSNRGLPGRVFASEDEARLWLFADSESDSAAPDEARRQQQ